MTFFAEFKKFAMRGNVIDLAVAVVVGTAFSKIVSSLVDGIIMPVIGLLLGGINISSKSWVIGQAVVKWGMFLQSIIDFTLISFSIFVAVKLINLFYKKESEVPKLSKEETLLMDIRDILKNHLKTKG